jgi:hypothetical protein
MDPAVSESAFIVLMRLLQRHRFVLLFLAVLVFCAVMIIRQFQMDRRAHIERREAFILLSAKGYTADADKLFARLMKDLPGLSIDQVVDDFQRTLLIVNPTESHPESPVWRYHWTVSRQLEERAYTVVERARKIAEKE